MVHARTLQSIVSNTPDSFNTRGVLVTFAFWVNVPAELLVNRPRPTVHSSNIETGSTLHSRRSPDTPNPPDWNPAPVTVIVAGLGRLSPSSGVTSRVTLGLEPLSGAASAAPAPPRVKAAMTITARR
jgi:hypothetical protein